ncbi:MAG: exopolyphosphatase [Nitrospinaceae bacterium]|nr:MAG: exopolyphosphatase [Nitrospinaceae bacterium]
MKKFASIDIGSNTVRLLVLQAGQDESFREIESIRRITRLGEGMDSQKSLAPGPMEITLKVLEEFRDVCGKHGDIPIRAVATSAVREAQNQETFINEALKRTGIAIEVISWEEEARLTLEGVFWKIPHQDRKILTFDIGGGSTEFILSEGRQILGSLSTSLGTVRLTEKFIFGHPVSKEDYENLTAHIQSVLSSVKDQLPKTHPEIAIGTAGTVTTLAALNQNIYPYDPEKVHGLSLPVDQIMAIQEDLKSKSLDERRRLKPLERGREDLIIAGTAIVLETLNTFECPDLLVSEYSLREGIILEALARTL